MAVAVAGTSGFFSTSCDRVQICARVHSAHVHAISSMIVGTLACVYVRSYRFDWGILGFPSTFGQHKSIKRDLLFVSLTVILLTLTLTSLAISALSSWRACTYIQSVWQICTRKLVCMHVCAWVRVVQVHAWVSEVNRPPFRPFR